MQGMVCNGIYVIPDLALPIQKLILKTIRHQNYVVNCVDNDTRGRLYQRRLIKTVGKKKKLKHSFSVCK